MELGVVILAIGNFISILCLIWDQVKLGERIERLERIIAKAEIEVPDDDPEGDGEPVHVFQRAA